MPVTTMFLDLPGVHAAMFGFSHGDEKPHQNGSAPAGPATPNGRVICVNVPAASPVHSGAGQCRNIAYDRRETR